MNSRIAGNPPVSTLPRVPMNDLKGQWGGVRETLLRSVDRVGESGWWILGSEVRAFEAELAAHWGLRHAVGCANGLDAIEIALRALGLSPGDRVLTTPVSAFATTLAIVRAGGIPVFADVDASGLIDLEKARTVLAGDAGIRFFVPVHLYGHSLDLAKLEALKREFDLRIVEDCAQSIGARSDGRAGGSVGQFAATSFYPTKNLGCIGDGGALLTDSDSLAARARGLRDYGQTSKYVHSEIGLNSRLDELQAAILRDGFLPRLKENTARRAAISVRYREGIHHPKLEIPRPPRGSDSVWHLFPLFVHGNRTSFMEHLSSQGVESGIHYPIPIHRQAALERVPGHQRGVSLPVAEQFCERVVSIPIHPLLSPAEIDRVIEACNSWKE